MNGKFPFPCCRCGYCCLVETCPAGQVFLGVEEYHPCPGLSFEDGQADCQIALIDPKIIGVGLGCCIKARAVKGDKVYDFASLPPRVQENHLSRPEAEGADMMMIKINEETRKPATVTVEITMPLWRWKILLRRADALFEGDLGQCLSQIINVGFMTEIKMLGALKKDGALCN
jgi:hypothetical protein